MASSHNQLLLHNFLHEKNKETRNLMENLQDFNCIGSSHGCLAFINNDKNANNNNNNNNNNKNPFLLNPFSKTMINLPPKHTLPRFHDQIIESTIFKVVLCGDPSHDKSYTAIALHGISSYRTMIAICRHGDEKWTDLGSEVETCYDVVCCDKTKTVFVLGPGPKVELWDVKKTIPSKTMTIQDPCPKKLASDRNSYPHDLYSSQWYLGLSKSGQLFLVVRYIGEFVRYDGEVVYEADTLTDYASEPLVCPYKTVAFNVFKYDFDGTEWIDVERLDDQAMFLGGNQTMLVSTWGNEELKGNSIYFTDDYWERMDEDYSYGGHDMGIYNMEDGVIEDVMENQQQNKIEPAPFWITVPHDRS